MFAISVLMQGLESRMYEEFLEIVFFLLKTTCEKNWQKKKKRKEKLAKDLDIFLIRGYPKDEQICVDVP